ncbi:MAG TPA: sigma-54 dependent transcriptional regulator [Saprospiraceae bacterium]|nr:sigma-54 dependent transcriptional regulator [Saprospiraceae bacterium]HMQ82827.1 sigma-54 dependent transcriptional regulator [Saprospiraceae bacterium]
MANSKANLLIIDDDPTFLKELKEGLGNAFELYAVLSPEKAVPRLKERSFDLILLDLVFGSNDQNPAGLDFLATLKKEYPQYPVIVITQHGDEQKFRRALELGAAQFLRKESINYQIWQQVIDAEIAKQKALANIMADLIEPTANTVLTPTQAPNDPYPFLGNTPRIQEIREELIALSEETDITVLILGETGVGKENAARYLHSQGVKKDKPFEALNLVEVNKELVQSALFGHKKGSFTGAIEDKVGVFEQADGGILFLDEIGEIDPIVQAQLLRVLETGEVTPIGGKTRTVDVQIVAATNRDLKAAIAEGKFRQDLYARLNDYKITIPPLRERIADLRLIAEHYIRQRGAEPAFFSSEIWALFHQYHWPENIRELVNIIKRLLLKRKVAKKEVLDASFLPEEFFGVPHAEFIATVNPAPITDEPKALEQNHNLDYQTARRELLEIETAFREGRNKSAIVAQLGFENLDQLRYRIVDKYYEKYKDQKLFLEFPIICKKYKLIP